jgi:hypothetical protein
MHHICFEVDDIEKTLNDLKNANIPLIDEVPTVGTGGKKIAFIHPKGTNGVLVELYELSAEEPERRSEQLDAMRRRFRDGRRVHTAGAKAFLSRIRSGEEESGQENDQ